MVCPPRNPVFSPVGACPCFIRGSTDWFRLNGERDRRGRCHRRLADGFHANAESFSALSARPIERQDADHRVRAVRLPFQMNLPMNLAAADVSRR